MITARAWSGRRYAVLGLARSGAATVEALLASGAEVLAWDERAEARASFQGRVTLSDPLESDLTGYTGVVVSPGVPLNTHPIKPHADRFGVPVIGDVELFAQARSELPPHKVVGITGTNGKSTTTALVHHIIKTEGVLTTMGGNIGLPILEQDPLPEGGVYVLELSSYQIDLTYSLDCDVAVLLNVTPDHLDRYENFEAYRASKLRLFEMQSNKSVSVFHFDTDGYGDVISQSRPSDSWCWFSNDDLGLPESQSNWPSLQGSHNRQNVLAAINVAACLDIDEETIIQALRAFPGLPHRMERVAEISGIAYINDSKGTNTAASAPALAAFDDIHWIVGGLAKEPGLGECEAELSRVKAAYTIGDSGPAFAELLETRVPVTQSHTLDRAVRDASAKAREGDTVLLSPACASFDQFRDFEARGDAFKALVKELAA